MKLVPATLRGPAALDLGGVRFALPAALAARAAGVARLTFGMRSENLGLQRQADDSAALDAQVLLLAPLGAETLARFGVGAAEQVARCPASFPDTPDSRRTLHLQPGQMHLFNTDSGLAL